MKRYKYNFFTINPPDGYRILDVKDFFEADDIFYSYRTNSFDHTIGKYYRHSIGFPIFEQNSNQLSIWIRKITK
jgi:hypothetical protein